MAERALRTLIVDDEPLAVERLQILCAGIEDIALLGTANDGEAALRLVEALSPDLLLLDIAMPGLTGIEVASALERLDTRPAVIFCTAFDRFAVAWEQPSVQLTAAATRRVDRLKETMRTPWRTPYEWNCSS